VALLAGGFACLGALTACKTTGFTFGEQALPLPTYQVGDEFHYINDRKEKVLRKVVAVRGETVEWATETPYHYLAYRNFALPRIQWDGVQSNGKALTGVKADLLWPLLKGNEQTFTVKFQRFDKKKKTTKEYDQKWVCKVYKKRPVVVPAGKFDAQKITCKEKSKKGRTRRVRQWFYAPKLGHFVKRVKRYNDGATLSMELVSVVKTPRVTVPVRK
jgi:hypothetical protein